MEQRISASLVLTTNNEIACVRCKYVISPSSEPWKNYVSCIEQPMCDQPGKPYSNAKEVLLRQFFCPSCAALLDSETALKEDPFLYDVVKGKS